MKMISPVTVSPGTPLLEHGSLSLDFCAEEYFTADPIDDATILIDSNVLEDDADPWAAGTWNLGDQAIYDHRLYEVIADPSTTDQPDTGAAADAPTWLDLGTVNRFAMFDGIINHKTTNASAISIRIEPGTIVNALAFFGLSGSDLLVSMTDPTDGEVYSAHFDLQDNSSITDWYHWFFDDVVTISDMVVGNLPSYSAARIEISIIAGSASAECGELVIGKMRTIGTANFGTSTGIQDYSVKTQDAFGNFSITARAYAKRADYDVTIETNKVAGVQALLASLRATPVVWIGDEDRVETLVYGFFKDFSMVLSDPSISQCSIEVEGLT